MIYHYNSCHYTIQSYLIYYIQIGTSYYTRFKIQLWKSYVILCSTKFQQLRHKLNKTYQIEQIELNARNSWVEKSKTIRGKYNTSPLVSRNKDKIKIHDINDVKEVIQRLIINKPSNNQKTLYTILWASITLQKLIMKVTWTIKIM